MESRARHFHYAQVVVGSIHIAMFLTVSHMGATCSDYIVSTVTMMQDTFWFPGAGVGPCATQISFD